MFEIALLLRAGEGWAQPGLRAAISHNRKLYREEHGFNFCSISATIMGFALSRMLGVVVEHSQGVI